MTPYVAAFFCWISAGLLALPIDRSLNTNREVFGLENSLDRILGSAKEVIGDELFLKADSYYHGGVKEKFHEKDGDHEKEGFIEEQHDDDQHEHDGGKKKNKDWIETINDRVTMHRHYHLEGEKIREMLPFFSLATALDPHNVEAVLTTAYWLEKQFHKTQDAVTLLEKAVLNNPASWEVENALANLYFRAAADWTKSEAHYRAALKKAEGQKTELYERLDMNYYLAQALEKQGRNAEALLFYREALKYFSGKNPAALKGILLEKTKELSYNAD